jgi:hypothetical protein
MRSDGSPNRTPTPAAKKPDSAMWTTMLMPGKTEVSL